ncbi:hypothetical protein ACIQU4_30835 [Streptomyces sp. NPDC090741]|uniref:hypothetical protein n=1 Tax=Streptomyces sp. NPDC090741 TaxID=3365967 RepID=UPI00381C8AE3
MQRGYYGPKDPVRAPLGAARRTGMRTVALTTAHTAAGLGADVAVRDLPAVSVPVGGGDIAVSTGGRD